MKDIIHEIADTLWNDLQKGKNSILVTLTSDKGSAPRSKGACMVVDDAGLAAGTIGGGNMEFLALREAEELLKQKKGKVSVFNLSGACGGKVEVLFTFVAPTEQNKQAVHSMQCAIKDHKAGWLVLPFTAEKMGFLCIDGIAGIDIPVEKMEITSVKGCDTIDTSEGTYYVMMIYNSIRVFIFGGGHVAQKLVPMLRFIGFRCIVTDDRPEFAAPELFPDAEACYVRDYNELEEFYDIQPEDYIISVTRGHEGDFEVERFALRTPASYIGVIGSRTKHAMVAEKLKKIHFTDSDLARVTAPIGLDIGSETPAEIAVSIAGQLIEKRAGRKMHTMGGY